MIRARQLGALLLLAHVAFAQTATNIPAAPTVTNMSISGQDTEVRIDVSATAAVSSTVAAASARERATLSRTPVASAPRRNPRRLVVAGSTDYADYTD